MSLVKVIQYTKVADSRFIDPFESLNVIQWVWPSWMSTQQSMVSHNSMRQYRGHHVGGHRRQTSGRCLSRTSLGYRTTTGIVSGFSTLMSVSIAYIQSNLSHYHVCFHRRSQNFLWGYTFFLKKLTTLQKLRPFDIYISAMRCTCNQCTSLATPMCVLQWNL